MTQTLSLIIAYYLFPKKPARNSMLWQTSIIWLCRKEEPLVAQKSLLLSYIFHIAHFWMFTSRKVDPRKDYFHERTLMSACKKDNSSFDKLLKKDSSFSTYCTNIPFYLFTKTTRIKSIQSDERCNVQDMKQNVTHTTYSDRKQKKCIKEKNEILKCGVNSQR